MLKSTLNSSLSQFIFKLKRPLKRKFQMMKMMRRRMKRKTMMSKLNKMRKRKIKRRRKLKKSQQKLKNLTRTNQSGWRNQKKLPNKNMLTSTRVYLKIGKTILLSSFSQLKVVFNSSQLSMFQKELHSICSKPRRRKITSSYMLEESSLWTIAINWFLNI